MAFLEEKVKDTIKKFISVFFDKTFLKFILIGVINTIVGTTIMFVFYNVLDISYWISTASNYFLTSILSFFLNKYFTFKNQKSSFMQIVRFAVNILVCYFVAYGIAKQLALYIFEFAGERLQNNIAMIIGMGLFTGLNYIGQRFFCFKEKPEGDGENE